MIDLQDLKIIITIDMAHNNEIEIEIEIEIVIVIVH
jgi:hypothetical protein